MFQLRSNKNFALWTSGFRGGEAGSGSADWIAPFISESSPDNLHNIDNPSDSEYSQSAYPENTRSSFSYIETVDAEIPQENTEQKGYQPAPSGNPVAPAVISESWDIAGIMVVGVMIVGIMIAVIIIILGSVVVLSVIAVLIAAVVVVLTAVVVLIVLIIAVIAIIVVLGVVGGILCIIAAAVIGLFSILAAVYISIFCIVIGGWGVAVGAEHGIVRNEASAFFTVHCDSLFLHNSI